jgi:membrane protease YdiL (CAAX protease family)
MMNRMAGAPESNTLRFADLARLGRTGWRRDALAAALVVGLWLASNLVFLVVMLATGLDLDALMHPEGGPLSLASRLTLGGTLLWIYAFALGCVFAALSWVYRRPWRTVLTARSRFDWRALWSSLLVGLLICLIMASLTVLDEDGAAWVFDETMFWALLPLTLVLVPIQTLSEEVVFRGYLLQRIGLRSRRPLVRLLAPAALFWLGHLPIVMAIGFAEWMALYYAIVSLYLTWLVLRCDGIEHAYGLHMAINFTVFIVVGTASTIPLSAPLFVALGPESAALPLGAAVFCALHYAIVFKVLRPPRPPLIFAAGPAGPSSDRSPQAGPSPAARP